MNAFVRKVWYFCCEFSIQHNKEVVLAMSNGACMLLEPNEGREAESKLNEIKTLKRSEGTGR